MCATRMLKKSVHWNRSRRNQFTAEVLEFLEVFFWFASVLYARERFALHLQARMSSTCLSSSQEKVVSCCGRLVHLFQSPFPLLRSCMMLRGGVHARGRDWETEATGRIWHDLTLVARKPTSSCDRISSAEISGSHWSHACVCLHSAYLEAQSRRDFRTWMVCCWLGFFKKKIADTNMQHYVVCGLELWIPRNLPIVIPETSNIFGGTIIFGCTFNMYCWLQPHHCCLFFAPCNDPAVDFRPSARKNTWQVRALEEERDNLRKDCGCGCA